MNLAEAVALKLAERSPQADHVPAAALVRKLMPLARDIVLTVLESQTGHTADLEMEVITRRSAATLVPTSRLNFIKEEHRIFKEALLQIEQALASGYRLGGSEKIRTIFESLEGLLHPTVQTNQTD